ncbi:Rap1a/Tai family immunity protein [Bradyrhizobium sp. BR 1432]|uniref:Rap1a/Tai family immunity protein n=1 Tax=Bradyrhizobium sp. BR 1432 TaxID=3447966 RepID=UPI003EE6B29E
MTKTTLIAALTLALLTAEATAQTESGGTTRAHAQIYVSADTLHEWCQQQPARAMYYVAGVLDALTLAANNAGNAPVCIPVTSTLAQARDVVCKHLRDNPEKRQYNTASLVWTAQSQAWPCRK